MHSGSDASVRAISTVTTAAPNLVCVVLGFPRQEKLIQILRRALPHACFLACGGGIPMPAGVFIRASPTMQRMGLEWIHRMLLEPCRLTGRYVRDDLPFAIGVLARSAMRRFRDGRLGIRARSQRT